MGLHDDVVLLFMVACHETHDVDSFSGDVKRQIKTLDFYASFKMI